VQIGIVADDDFIRTLIHGVKANDEKLNEETLRAKRVQRLRDGEKNCWLEIVLDEGKNRQIRRMMKAMDVEVLRLYALGLGR
jgi:23S rRNA pseudouridine2605 synthase